MQPDLESPEPATLAGLRLCAFESRLAPEMKSMIERLGGQAAVAPSLREVPLEENSQALEFGQRLTEGQVDVVIFLTGVGTRALYDILATRWPGHMILAALDQTIVIVRGPKPAAVLRSWKCRIDHHVPEPNTWREILALADASVDVAGKVVAIQEYGQPNLPLYEGLCARRAAVLPVPVYRWSLPENREPLNAAIAAAIAGQFDVLLFTSAQQIVNVLTVAELKGQREAFLSAARRTVVASIGPTASAALCEAGLPPDLEPQRNKMGHLIWEVARRARTLLPAKRAPNAPA